MFLVIGNPQAEHCIIDGQERRVTSGPVLTFGATLAGLGIPVAAVGHGGIAERESLIAAGIDTRLFACPGRPTVIDRHRPDAAPAIRAGEPISGDGVDLDLAFVRGLILAPSLGDLEPFSLPAAFHDRTLVSASGFLHRESADGTAEPSRPVHSPRLEELRRACGLLHAPLEEARFLTGSEDPAAACRRLHEDQREGGIVLITTTGQGTHLHDRSGAHHSPGEATDPRYHAIVAAALLVAHLEEGLSGARALRFAVAAGNLATSRMADPKQRTWPWPSRREVLAELAGS